MPKKQKQNGEPTAHNPDRGVRELQAEGDRVLAGQATSTEVVPDLRAPHRGAHHHRSRGDRQEDDQRRGERWVNDGTRDCFVVCKSRVRLSDGKSGGTHWVSSLLYY